jgi:hypothetical protein
MSHADDLADLVEAVLACRACQLSRLRVALALAP